MEKLRAWLKPKGNFTPILKNDLKLDNILHGEWVNFVCELGLI